MTTLLSDIEPLLSQSVGSHIEAKSQARSIDRALGYRCEEIEQELRERYLPKNRLSFGAGAGDTFIDQDGHSRQFWVGLDVQSLQTPYSELLEILEVVGVRRGQKWIDLGAGYGRLGIVLSSISLEAEFLGYEVIPERVEEGRRIFSAWNLPSAKLETADIAAAGFDIPIADVYFIYDFGSARDIGVVLGKLAEISRHQKIQVVARGRGIRHAIMQQHPWLSEVEPAQHFPHWSLFSAGREIQQ